MEVSKYVWIFSQDQVRQRGRSMETNAGRWWRWLRGKGVLVVRLHNCFDSWVGCAVDNPKYGSTNQRAHLGTFKTNLTILTNWIFVITMTRPSKSPVELHFSQSSYNASIYSWSCPTLAIEFAFGHTFSGTVTIWVLHPHPKLVQISQRSSGLDGLRFLSLCSVR